MGKPAPQCQAQLHQAVVSDSPRGDEGEKQVAENAERVHVQAERRDEIGRASEDRYQASEA